MDRQTKKPIYIYLSVCLCVCLYICLCLYIEKYKYFVVGYANRPQQIIFGKNQFYLKSKTK